jgi:acyl-CoA thioester hydrolase
MPIAATAADIDELGHVSNVVYLRWVLDVAVAHSRSVGWDYAQYRALGSAFVVRRHEIDYVASVLEGQQVVAETWVDSWKQASVVRRTDLRRGETVVARASSLWAFVSLTTGRPQRIPDALLAAFGAPYSSDASRAASSTGRSSVGS